MEDYFEYRHTIAFAETGLSGTVDYVHYLHWQKRCRELFVRHRAQGVGSGLYDLKLFTLQVECELFGALGPLDRVSIRMRADELGHTKFGLTFDYVKETADGGDLLVARGRQRIACICGPDDAPVPALIPDVLALALASYAAPTRSLAGRQI